MSSRPRAATRRSLWRYCIMYYSTAHLLWEISCTRKTLIQWQCTKMIKNSWNVSSIFVQTYSNCDPRFNFINSSKMVLRNRRCLCALKSLRKWRLFMIWPKQLQRALDRTKDQEVKVSVDLRLSQRPPGQLRISSSSPSKERRLRWRLTPTVIFMPRRRSLKCIEAEAKTISSSSMLPRHSHLRHLKLSVPRRQTQAVMRLHKFFRCCNNLSIN